MAAATAEEELVEDSAAEDSVVVEDWVREAAAMAAVR